ncbi:GNAT family N-acetyltransferase [Sphingomonas sp.]|jgi:putative acetyltransferase|uniref:GNAT family N-acetyltransferase n=1 Tax=Sphingomonas sp. TaxID=28214 RepID=UPI002E377387|nr:GNAT family N-acetyltransferase [Sphingomonas sp.]HEX4694148.1 GNAT family N-acetyltransferase [Sphingomonas sp.]
MRIEVDDLSRAEVVALVELHLREAFASSPACHVFALDTTKLADSAVMLWTAWEDGELLAMGALKHLDAEHGEIKSMRTAPGALRRGVGRAMLDHLIGEARARNYRLLSLETGNNEPFAPARALYQRAGFVECEPFADYTDVSFSRYFTLAL